MEFTKKIKTSVVLLMVLSTKMILEVWNLDFFLLPFSTIRPHLDHANNQKPKYVWFKDLSLSSPLRPSLVRNELQESQPFRSNFDDFHR